MMDGRRWRRRSDNQTLLPLRSRTRQRHHSTVSCWYCDVKFLSLNEPLYRFGRRYSRYLRVWFSMGIGFTMAALLGVTLLIFVELSRTLLVYAGHASPDNDLFGLSSLLTGLDISLPRIGYLCISSVLCVLVHEFGHALAAASEGIQMEYLAVFMAGLFPGALVAFNYASLQSLPGAASLRIYCAGIWHNAAFCAVCILALLSLPVILNPFYIYGENPMVLDVPFSSPLSSYLSPRDVIFSLGDIPLHTPDDWKKSIFMLTEQNHGLVSNRADEILNLRKGYCVPHTLIEESIELNFEGNQTFCPNELIAFASMPCWDVSNFNDSGNGNDNRKRSENIHCLDAKDVVKLRKCANNRFQAPRNASGCLCSEVEACLIPLQLPGQGWVEIKYLTPDCESLVSKHEDSHTGEKRCLQTFVFVGDLISMGHSIRLTSYQPRWSTNFAAYVPSQLENFFTCSFHVSMVLALLNSLPVYFLDGESILEVTIDSFGWLSSRRKRLILRFCLLGGTFISTTSFLLMLFVALHIDMPNGHAMPGRLRAGPGNMEPGPAQY